MAFDILHRDGRDLTACPLADRRARLEDARRGQRPGVPGAAAGGLAAWQQVVERGFEGDVAKDEASVYEGGLRGGG